MVPGDVIDVEIGGIGSLRNRVVAEDEFGPTTRRPAAAVTSYNP